MVFQSANILLDKGIARRVYELQARRARGKIPTQLQIEALTVFARLQLQASRLFISRETANVLLLRPPVQANEVLDYTEILHRGKYLSRWARRLRSFMFSREDARMIAYASFGIDSKSQLAEVEIFVTNDNHLARNFQVEHIKIKTRFDRMVGNLREPYSGLQLPTVMTTAEVLAVR